MKILIYILRIVYRIRFYLIGIPLLVTLLAIYLTRNLQRNYQVSSTIYTGIASGYSIESGTGVAIDWHTVNNTIDNIINIIYAKSTLKKVSMRLYARCMIYGDAEKDNNYITAANYRALMQITPPDVKALIDRGSEDRTVERLLSYEKPLHGNFIYELFNHTHPHYSYAALSKIVVKRLSDSDMLDLSYVSDDPGIAYNTMEILNDEFVNQYKDLRFAETNDVIEYFRQQLKETGDRLREAEDSLTDYSIAKKVINYDEQTKHVAALSKDFETSYEGVLREYEGATALVEALDERIEESTKRMVQNAQFSAKLKNISDLTTTITRLEAFQPDTAGRFNRDLNVLRERLRVAEDDFTSFNVPYSVSRYSKEGVANTDIINQWLAELLRKTKAEAELDVMRQRREQLDAQYEYYSPIGSTLKRKERDISLTEQSYLEVLNALHHALLRQKNLQMSSASLKVINPPIFPIAPMPHARKMIVAATFFASLIFVLGFFVILELLDRTMRDKVRTERITGGRVLGAFPAFSKLKHRGYNKECSRMAASFLGNAVQELLDSSRPRNTVNLLHTEDALGQRFIADQLMEYWQTQGIKARVAAWGEEPLTDVNAYLHARSLDELCPAQDEQVIVVLHPSLVESSVPAALLSQADANIFIASADRVWKDTDQLLYDRMVQQTGEVKPWIYLTQAARENVEVFTGMMPPYTTMRKVVDRFIQLGLTAKR